MHEILTALGLVFVLEGLLYGLAPVTMKKMMMQMLTVPADKLRNMGFIAAIAGIIFVWLLNR